MTVPNYVQGQRVIFIKFDREKFTKHINPYLGAIGAVSLMGTTYDESKTNILKFQPEVPADNFLFFDHCFTWNEESPPLGTIFEQWHTGTAMDATVFLTWLHEATDFVHQRDPHKASQMRILGVALAEMIGEKFDLEVTVVRSVSPVVAPQEEVSIQLSPRTPFSPRSPGL